MKDGDLLHIAGKDHEGNATTFYAEMVGKDATGKLEVFYLEQTKKMEGYIWSYADDWDTVDKDCVIKSFRPTRETYVSIQGVWLRTYCKGESFLKAR